MARPECHPVLRESVDPASPSGSGGRELLPDQLKAAEEVCRLDEPKACIEASGLAKAKASEPVVFSDRVGYIALLVAGTCPQKHMKSRKVRCFGSTRKASAEAAAGRRW
ncbi:hypothetical protein [Aurantimonas sp. HBX-1]|uniref:hypothetical protein n=1 Tax=Aurantimonas sp. HBX-1 TaxID=2906072 RepID=UPI001F1AF2C2|nr:hypothetical protein [Aurantimonas sp. HBX-1]UIJ71088.1 hypothetical protein LXB15_15355 [Aurantimonas sp. HBX-1]